MVARVSELVELLAALSLRLRNRAEHVEAQMETVNAVVRSMGETGLICHYVMLGPTFGRPYVDRSDTAQIVQAALLVPEGFGVCYWEMEEHFALSNSPDGLDAEARVCFKPFNQCTDEEKAFLGPFVAEMLEDMHDTAFAEASRLESGVDVSLGEYFGRGNGAGGEGTP